ncbi:hypothetical protein IFM89_030978 [Coptis chinensis]|uniref:L-lactate dehydrogenase n=1 Tax=Coptis chinensis TaxID=261450 RepID=A0A835H6Y1_9MAGN|nr:hypothetical protein IFM89_030978 [Coptis chinensis]
MQKSSSSASFGPEGLNMAQSFFKPIQQTSSPSSNNRQTKISVIGTGNVGMAIAQTILTQDLTDILALVDAKPEKLRGEMLDLQHAAAFLPRTKILASVDYSVTEGSDLCIVTAGARQISGESRLNLLQRNLTLFRDVIPPLAKYSPDSILVIVSNPVDVLTYVAWKLSGFPANRVIGSGTNLDSSRFRFLIADHLDVNAQDVQDVSRGQGVVDPTIGLWRLLDSSENMRWYPGIVKQISKVGCKLGDPRQAHLISILFAVSIELTISFKQAYIVGEHGDSSVALWSSISVGGVPVLSFLEKQQIVYEKETLENIHKAVVESAYEVISLKGYTSWAIGYSVANLARTLLRDQRKIHPVSILAKGFYGIDEGEVFLSLPAQLGRGGVIGITNVHLTDEEAQKLRDSAKTIAEVQSQLGI